MVGALAFWQLFPGVFPKTILVALLVFSTWFYLLGKNRMPFLITGTFVGAAILARQSSQEHIPLFVSVFSVFFLGLLFYFARYDVSIDNLPEGALVSLLLAQSFWLLSFWPFGEQTIGAVFAAIFFALFEMVDSRKHEILSTIQ